MGHFSGHYTPPRRATLRGSTKIIGESDPLIGQLIQIWSRMIVSRAGHYIAGIVISNENNIRFRFPLLCIHYISTYFIYFGTPKVGYFHA